jgi:hypothetical protein
MKKTRAKIEVEVFLRLLDNEVLKLWELFMAQIIAAISRENVTIQPFSSRYFLKVFR